MCRMLPTLLTYFTLLTIPDEGLLHHPLLYLCSIIHLWPGVLAPPSLCVSKLFLVLDFST